jgi:hypothetical protein
LRVVKGKGTLVKPFVTDLFQGIQEPTCSNTEIALAALHRSA